MVFLAPPQVHVPAALARARGTARTALSGAAAEGCVGLALYPVDTWKARAHLNGRLGRRPGLAVWKGASTTVLRSAVDAGVFMVVYEGVRVWVGEKCGEGMKSFLAAAVATVASGIVEAPFAFVSERVRLRGGVGIRGVLREGVRGVGVRGLWVGAGAGLIRDLPFEALDFSIFDRLTRDLRAFRARETGVVKKLSRFETLVLGMITGGIVGAIVSPLDLVVTRVISDPLKYRGVCRTLTRVAREEGLPAVFRGIGHKVARDAASSALFFTLYDTLQPGGANGNDGQGSATDDDL